jgi:hypothetical protein
VPSTTGPDTEKLAGPFERFLLSVRRTLRGVDWMPARNPLLGVAYVSWAWATENVVTNVAMHR